MNNSIPYSTVFLKMAEPPPAVGTWQFGGPGCLTIPGRVRPNWLKRWACHHILGFAWKDFT